MSCYLRRPSHHELFAPVRALHSFLEIFLTHEQQCYLRCPSHLEPFIPVRALHSFLAIPSTCELLPKTFFPSCVVRTSERACELQRPATSILTSPHPPPLHLSLPQKPPTLPNSSFPPTTPPKMQRITLFGLLNGEDINIMRNALRTGAAHPYSDEKVKYDLSEVATLLYEQMKLIPDYRLRVSTTESVFGLVATDQMHRFALARPLWPGSYAPFTALWHLEATLSHNFPRTTLEMFH